MLYFPLGHQSGPVGSCLGFPLDFFFALYPALTLDFVGVPEPFVLPFAGDEGAFPVLSLRLGLVGRLALVER